MQVSFDIDGYVLYNNSISVRNPPEICMDVPYLKSAASVCLKFYDMVFSRSGVSGCIEMVARLASIKLNKIKLGCFDLLNNLVTNESFFKTRYSRVYNFLVASDNFLKS